MYGLGEPKFTHFKPLMSLYARVVQTRRLAAGARVSYLGTWQAQHDTTIATLPLGYADGVRRELSNKLSVFIPQANNYFKQIGLITMDQLMIDLAEADSEIQAGTVIELIGRNLPLVKWTRLCSSITYELACNLSLRLPRIYTRDF
jgi:alanine racemase